MENNLDKETRKVGYKKKYMKFYEAHGYIPKYFEPYNGREVIDYSPTITAHSNTSPTHVGTILIVEKLEKRR